MIPQIRNLPLAVFLFKYAGFERLAEELPGVFFIGILLESVPSHVVADAEVFVGALLGRTFPEGLVCVELLFLFFFQGLKADVGSDFFGEALSVAELAERG